jgi:hypothetical protein
MNCSELRINCIKTGGQWAGDLIVADDDTCEGLLSAYESESLSGDRCERDPSAFDDEILCNVSPLVDWQDWRGWACQSERALTRCWGHESANLQARIAGAIARAVPIVSRKARARDWSEAALALGAATRDLARRNLFCAARGLVCALRSAGADACDPWMREAYALERAALGTDSFS